MAACTCRLAVFFLAVAAHGQMFSAGVRVGWVAPSNPGSNYKFGPTAEFKPPVVPLRFVVDSLYSKLSTPQQTAAVWDVPLMIRLESPAPVLKPFLMGGALIRRITVAGGETAAGFTFGAGLRIGLPRIKLTPEFRVSRAEVAGRDIPATTGEFLIGITF
jgi:hypothetical protein